jgi:hypothetical protein
VFTSDSPKLSDKCRTLPDKDTSLDKFLANPENQIRGGFYRKNSSLYYFKNDSDFTLVRTSKSFRGKLTNEQLQKLAICI